MVSFKKFLFTGLAFWMVVLQLHAGNKIKYAVSDIPADLLHGANSVLRLKKETFELKAEKRAVLTIHYVITVLNKAGNRNGIFIQPYNRFSTVSQIRGTLYDKNGKKIKNFKQEDIDDVVADLGASLYTDTRLKYINPQHTNYPYTVEYSCQVDFSSLLNVPSWHVYQSYQEAIQEEHFKFITHDNNNPTSPLAIRYYPNSKNIVIKKTGKLSPDGKSAVTYYTYDVSNLKAVQPEMYSKPLSQITPVVYFTPINFVVAGYHGSFSTWNDFGSFIRLLNKDRDALPEETREKVHQLTASDTCVHQKVETLYTYMQNKVHYVSISKGIQGWQPMPAAKVDELNYGDCKALTNYMKSLLETAGVKAYYTLVRASADASSILTKFPSNQFNHAILCVPEKKDTLWLECTSQHIPCGYIGEFTDDRDVLVITDSHAFLTRTPRYSGKENVKSRKTEVTIETDGTCNMHVVSSNTGEFYDENLHYLLMNEKKRKQTLLNNLHLPTIQLESLRFTADKNHTVDNKPLPVIRSDIQVVAAHYASTVGNYFILPLFPFSRNNGANIRFRKRHYDIFIRRSYSVVDTIVYHIPAQMTVAKIPASKTLTTQFGTYRYTVTKEGDKVIYVRKLTVNKGDYPPSDYLAFYTFLENKAGLDRIKLVLSL
jgi:hypothetical protein